MGEEARASITTLRGDIERLRNGRFDAALLLPNSFHAALLAHQARIPERWGFRADVRAPLLTRAVPKPRGAAPAPGRVLPAPDAGARHPVRARASPRFASATSTAPRPIACCANTGGTGDRSSASRRARRTDGRSGGRLSGWASWPRDSPGRPARASSSSGPRPIASTVDIVVAAARAAGAGAAAILDLAGKTDLPALAGVLSRCRSFVSNDSGAMHLAAAVDVPVVGIFGPTREWATSPLPGPRGLDTAIVHTDVWCRPCMLRTCPIDHRCMTGIAVDDVIAPVLVSLGRARRPRETP